MYNIIINGEIVSTVFLPCYVRWEEPLRSFVTCDYARAEAVMVTPEQEVEEPVESFYADLIEKDIRHAGFPVATIIKVEA